MRQACQKIFGNAKGFDSQTVIWTGRIWFPPTYILLNSKPEKFSKSL